MQTALIARACMTQLTRQILAGEKNPSRNMSNRKPYRTVSQKKAARASATKGKDGTFRSSASVSFHKPVKG